VNIEKLKKKIEKFPRDPGVYFFHRAPKPGRRRLNKTSNIIYVGKATSLRDRVKSYFRDDLHTTRGPLLVEMLLIADDVTFVKTDTALEALILEGHWIRLAKPFYNTKEKDDKSYNYVVITKEDFPIVTTIRGHDLAMAELSGGLPFDIKYIFGPYPHGGSLKIALKIIRGIFPNRDFKCIPYPEQLEKIERKLSPSKTRDAEFKILPSKIRDAEFSNHAESVGKIRACFNRQIGVCPGFCTGEVTQEEYTQTIRNLKMFFEGKKKTLLRILKKEMTQAAEKQKFEYASEIKRTIFALTHIQDIALMKRDSLLPKAGFRIEAYDVAHISGTSVVGVMTVVEDGEAKKSDYRKFRIRWNKKDDPFDKRRINSSDYRRIDDTGALQEILSRRFNHPEWTKPDLIVVDGGVAQMNAARKVLTEKKLEISLSAVTKNERHKPKSISGTDKVILEKRKNEILLANSEAHRFAIAYHRNLRGRSFKRSD